jgi:hypothetical protein
MRDIKDQMRDLKGKISSLREQARVDSMKRRSLQSLRTPSPFTHSQIDQWYAEAPSNRASVINTGSLPSRNPWNGEEESSVDGDAKEFAHPVEDHAEGEETDYADAETGMEPEPAADLEPSPSTPVAEINDAEDDVSDMHTENGEIEEDQEEALQNGDDADDMSESGESLYHDTVQYQISHEDREDAFDYEHFFLHSAMGTMSLTRRASTESFSSEDSVETTRGPVSNGTNGEYRSGQPLVLGRRNSSNSISTIDTFATAQEGRSLKSPVSPDEYHSIYDGSSRATSAQSHRYRSGSTATAKRHSFTPASTHLSAPSTGATRDSDGSISPIAEESSVAGSPANHHHTNNNHSRPATTTTRRGSVIHRPSTASFDSVGTNRSFPLVNKPPQARKAHSTTGVLTPRDSPDQDRDHRGVERDAGDRDSALNTIASRLMSDIGKVQGHARGNSQGMADGDATAAAATANGDADGGEEGAAIGGAQQQEHPLEALLREDRYLVERVVASLGRCVLGLTENGRASAESRMYRRRIDAARRILEGRDGGDGLEQ